MEIADILFPRLPKALANAEHLEKYYEEVGIQWRTVECNPMTDVPEIIKEMEIV